MQEAIAIDGEPIMTPAEWNTLLRIEELKTEAWERHLKQRMDFAVRLERYLNKIPAMVEEMEAVGK